MTSNLLTFFKCFFHPTVVGRSLKVAMVVGPVLMTINHFEIFLGAGVTPVRLLKICITFFVPFCVSGFSSARTMIASMCNDDACGADAADIVK